MKKFKYFTISYEPPHSDVKTFHNFCLCRDFYYRGYSATYGYKCPVCWGNGHINCKFCRGSGKISDRKPVVKEYIKYRREYRKALQYWRRLHDVWVLLVNSLTEDQQDALEIFGSRR